MFPNELPSVAIIGRENVGKSTLFNKLTEKQQALTSKIPGTTRDRHFDLCFWQGYAFNIIDTGGFNSTHFKKKTSDSLEKIVLKQIQTAISQASLILFVLDGQEKLSDLDREISKILRSSGKPVFSVINKLDNPRVRKNYDPGFKRLGWPSEFLISSLNGVGVGDLLDAVVEKIHPPKAQELDLNTWTRIAIIGRPNVGKSSLANAILGEERVIVNDQPHTTRASQDIYFTYRDHPLLLIDTAGLRKKSKIFEDLESQSAKMSLSSLDNCDLVLFLLPANEPISHQDKHLLSQIIAAQKSVILIASKWDLAEKQFSPKDYESAAKQFLPSFNFVPVLCASAKTGFNIEKILPLALKISSARNLTISQKDLDWLLANAPFTPPTRKKVGEKLLKVHGLQQWGIRPPYFVVIVNEKYLAPKALADIIKKSLRQKYHFLGTPINVYLKNKSDISQSDSSK